MSSDYHQINDDQNRIILQTLMDSTDDEEVIKVISCFTIESTGADIVKRMSQLNVPSLKKASQYLDIPEATSKSKLKANIISDLVDRLNALLMEMCLLCGEYYSEEMHEKPLVKCILCQQGCHNACHEPIITHLKELDEKQLKCYPFMCASCLGENSKEPTNDMSLAPKNKKSPTKEIQKPKDTKNKDDDVPGSPRSINGFIVEEPDDGKKANDPKAPEVPKEDKSKIPVCPDYKWGRCPNYEQCQYRHPPRCWSWLEKGKCTYNKKCRYHHPPLCFTSLWEKQCFNQECKFFHLQKTKRYKMEEEQLKTSLNAGNYHSQFPTIEQAKENHQNPDNRPPQRAIHHSQQNDHPNAHKPPLYSTATNNHPTHTPQRQAPQNPNHRVETPAQPRINKDDMSFLVVTIKEILKQEIGKEMETMKQKLALQSAIAQVNPQSQKQNIPLLIPNPQILNQSAFNL